MLYFSLTKLSSFCGFTWRWVKAFCYYYKVCMYINNYLYATVPHYIFQVSLYPFLEKKNESSFSPLSCVPSQPTSSTTGNGKRYETLTLSLLPLFSLFSYRCCFSQGTSLPLFSTILGVKELSSSP